MTSRTTYKLGMALLCVALSVGAGMLAFAMGGSARCADARAAWDDACREAAGDPGDAPHAQVTLGADLVERMIDDVVADLAGPLASAIGSISTPLGVSVPIRLEAIAANKDVAAGSGGEPIASFDLELRLTASAIGFEAGCLARVRVEVPLEIRDADSGPILGVDSSGARLSEPEIEPIGAGRGVAMLTQLAQERLRALLGDPAINALGDLELARLGAFGVADTALSLEPVALVARDDGSVSAAFISNAAWVGNEAIITEVGDDSGATLALPQEAALVMALQALAGGDGLSFDTRGRRDGPLRVVPREVALDGGSFDVAYDVHRASTPCASLSLRVLGTVEHDASTGELAVNISEHELVDSNRNRAMTNRAVPNPDELGESLTELLRDVLAVRPVRFVGGSELEFEPTGVRFERGTVFVDGVVR